MVLQVEHVSKEYRNKKVLDDVCFEITDTDCVCLSGASGTGKTTLLNIISGMDVPDIGEICIDGKPVVDFYECRRGLIGYLSCGNSLLESLTVMENMELVTKDMGCVKGLLQTLGIAYTSGSYPRELSSGEYKRVCFARALAQNPTFLVMDEPTSNLDKDSAEKIIQVINEKRGKVGMIIATHDPRICVCCDREQIL